MDVVKLTVRIQPPFVAPRPSGVAIRTRLKGLRPEEEKVLELVGAHLGSLASRDLKVRCAQRLGHSAESWAARKRTLTPLSSSRWAGSLTRATHDQWALARRSQLAHIKRLEAGVGMIRHRLSQPVRAKGTKKAPGGYRSKHEWFMKSRRLGVLQDRLVAAQAEWDAGVVSVVRGGKRLLHTRHHLEAAQTDKAQWRTRWEAERWFCQADGEAGKRYGNETIRVTPDGEVSIKLPAASPTTSPERPRTATPRSGTPSPDSCTGHEPAASARSPSKTSTSRWRRRGRNTAAGAGSGGSSPACPPEDSARD